jgi:hypothetical protein
MQTNRKLFWILLLGTIGIVLSAFLDGCSKEVSEETTPIKCYSYVEEIDNDSTITKTEVLETLVTSINGSITVGFEVATMSDVNRYELMVSFDGINFNNYATIPAIDVTPNQQYSRTINF